MTAEELSQREITLQRLQADLQTAETKLRALQEDLLRRTLLSLDVDKRRQDLSTEWWKVGAAVIAAIGAWGAIIALMLRPHGAP
jgi:hypothetical protein